LKKSISAILVLLTIVLLFAILNLHNMPKPKNPKVLSPEIELAIKQTRLDEIIIENSNSEMKLNHIRISDYYGTYNGYIAVMIYSGFYTQAFNYQYVGGITLKYNNGNKITLWKHNEFYELDIAYEKGFLSKNDIKSIAYYQNEKIERLKK